MESIKNITVNGFNIRIDRISGKINSMINGCPQKFSGQLKGNIENLLNETEVSIYKKYGITYSKLRVKRDGYYLLISTKPDKPFDIWEP